MRYTDIVWDFDGTIVNSYPNSAWAFAEALRGYGYTEPVKEVKEKILISTRHALQHYSAKYGLDADKLKLRYREFEKINPDVAEMYPHIKDVLRRIKETGRKNHLFTNRASRALEYLKEAGIIELFDGLITGENLRRLKPAPDGFHMLYEQYRMKPEQMLMVGDREVDILAARAEGIDACLFNTSGIEVPEGTKIVLDDIRDLLQYL